MMKDDSVARQLEALLNESDKCAHAIQKLIPKIGDYDLVRLLKKIDADLADIRHNLAVTKRLAEK